jgi:ATP-binding cassette subfamily A (ABC1) protein 3
MTINTRLLIRQTWALTKKTLIIAVIRNWISTILRALILPIAFLVLLLNIKNLILGYGQYGVGSPVPVESLADAIPGSKKLVFIQPPGLGSDVARVVDQISSSLSGKQIVHLTDPNDLLTTCRQSLHGDSDCFGAVVFNDSPLSTGASSKGIWSYTIHTDNAKNGFRINVNKHTNDQDTIFLPLQVAIENAMTNSTIIPNTYMFTTISQEQQDINMREQYQRLVISTYSIAFFISMVSPIYHAVSMITSERESGMTQLIDAMGGSSHARIMSYVLAFDILYLPCWFIFGICKSLLCITLL